MSPLPEVEMYRVLWHRPNSRCLRRKCRADTERRLQVPKRPAIFRMRRRVGIRRGGVCVALTTAPRRACSTHGGLSGTGTRSVSTDENEKLGVWRAASSSGRGKHSPRKHQIPETCPALVEKIQFGPQFK